MCGEESSSIENKNYAITFTTTNCGALTPFELSISYKEKNLSGNSYNIIVAKRFQEATGCFVTPSVVAIDVDPGDYCKQTYTFLVDLVNPTQEWFFMNGRSSSFDNFSRKDSVILIDSKIDEDFNISLYSILEYKFTKVIRIADKINKNDNVIILKGFDIVKLGQELLCFTAKADSSSESMSLQIEYLDRLPVIRKIQ